jgi:hypothetical protein
VEDGGAWPQGGVGGGADRAIWRETSLSDSGHLVTCACGAAIRHAHRRGFCGSTWTGHGWRDAERGAPCWRRGRSRPAAPPLTAGVAVYQRCLNAWVPIPAPDPAHRIHIHTSAAVELQITMNVRGDDRFTSRANCEVNDVKVALLVDSNQRNY